MTEYRSSRDLDWTLLALTLVICILGIVQIYSATLDTVWRDAWWKQLLWVTVGLVLLYLTTRVDYHALLEQVPLLYVVSLGTLLAVLVVGREVFGSRRWIPLVGGFTLQVSEFAKLVIVLLVARYLSELRSDRLETRDLLKLGALVGFPMVLFHNQHHGKTYQCSQLK
jgi:rod shape determining protein RodA